MATGPERAVRTSGGDGIVLFRCTECGYVSISLGWLHGHIEGHRGYTRFNIQVPFTSTSPANVDELMEMTECIRVTGTETLPLDAIEEPERTRYP